MPRYVRTLCPGGTYFFTVVTHGCKPFLTSDLARSCLRGAWLDTAERLPFETLSVCLLPDHLHTVWRLPDGDADFSLRWARIKGFFSKRYLACGGIGGVRNASRRRTGEAGMWQRRFWEHLIKDEDDLRSALLKTVRRATAGLARPWRQDRRGGFQTRPYGPGTPKCMWFSTEHLRRHVDYAHHNPVKHHVAATPAEWPWSTFHKHVEKGLYDPTWGEQAPEWMEKFSCAGEI